MGSCAGKSGRTAFFDPLSRALKGKTASPLWCHSTFMVVICTSLGRCLRGMDLSSAEHDEETVSTKEEQEESEEEPAA